jgi:hypothetical protein
VRKGVELAKAGDVPMLKFLLGRILPRERLIELDLPEMNFADDAVEALGYIMRAVSEGRISPSEAAALGALINSQTHEKLGPGRLNSRKVGEVNSQPPLVL